MLKICFIFYLLKFFYFVFYCLLCGRFRFKLGNFEYFGDVIRNVFVEVFLLLVLV